MFAPLFVLLLVVPIVELAIIVRVARVIDVGPTLLLLIGISLLGAMLLKREGLAAWRRVQATMAEGRVPTTELADGALILFGGALLLTPGFLTDAVGFLCVLPPTRATMRGGFRKLLGFWTIKRFGPAGYMGSRVYRGHVTRSRRRGGPGPDVRADDPRGPSAPPAPSLHPPPGEDDSPDTG